ncbi:hypothetical protein DPMN_147689, partial [Dreissena polymorpha]
MSDEVENGPDYGKNIVASGRGIFLYIYFPSKYMYICDNSLCSSFVIDNREIQRWSRILKAFANSLDPDETPQNVASHQDPN